MARRNSTLPYLPAFLLVLLLCASELMASDPRQVPLPSPNSDAVIDSKAPKLTSQTRIALIRSLQAERVFARVLFPQGKQGLTIRNGVVNPTDMTVAQMVAENGAAAKPGDRCVISTVDIKEKEVIIEINGGPKRGEKWYRRIQVGGSGGTAQLPDTGASPQSLDAHGSIVKIEFDKYVPEMTGEQLRALLNPVFDFKALTTEEAYEKTLPPKVQEAIKNHQILVGMDKEMVVYAKGRAPRKVRDKDEKGNDYEEWIYGNPPEEVNFVRFQGNEVARLEIMTVDGQKIVKTEKELDLSSKQAELAEKKAAPKPANAPSLMRPGEQPEYGPPPQSQGREPRPEDRKAPPDGQPYPDSTGTPGSQPGAGNPPH
jgi:hypothetical protein